MAEKEQPKLPLPPLPTTAYTTKRSNKKRKTEEEKHATKKKLCRERDKTRVNIGVALERWRELRESKGFKTDAMVALFLMESYEKDPTNSTPWRPNPPAVPVSIRASRSRALALMRRICPNKAQQLIEENGSGAVAEVEVVVPEEGQAVESEEEEAGSREEEAEDEDEDEDEDEETDDAEEAVEEVEAKDGVEVGVREAKEQVD
ncbi:uncharacterized protein [Centroberyx affinis]|uniref:uncharacterized protein isoform X1 n=1 Tax=Centroberyx affinis TaxID=166261 RepID=UPI003A5BFC65